MERIIRTIDSYAGCGRTSSSQAAEIPGLLNCATSFFLSRAYHHLNSAFTSLAKHHADSDGQLLKNSKYASTVLPLAKPRTHYVACEHRNSVLFTDGASEDDKAGGRFVLVDTSDDYRIAGSVFVDPLLIASWKKIGIEQLISQIELFVLVAIRIHFREHLMSRKVLSWTDNESARFAAIKATSASKLMVFLRRALHES